MHSTESSVRTVVIVDDHRTFTELLTMALDSHERLACIGAATDARAAMTLLERVTPDILVMDYRLADDDGVVVTGTIAERWPQIAVVMLTAFPTRRLMDRAAAAGASALLPKNGALGDLIQVLLTAAPDQFVVPPALLRMLMALDRRERHVELTVREKDVLEQLATGRNVRHISRELGVTVNTTRGHVKSILAKLGAHTQLEAVAVAHRLGLVEVTAEP